VVFLNENAQALAEGSRKLNGLTPKGYLKYAKEIISIVLKLDG
jgi:hypothetical protein